MKTDLTAERARHLLAYDPQTGILTRRVALSRSTKVGDVAGYEHPVKRYVYLFVDGKRYFAHRVIWLMQTGAWPPETIDHRDGDRKNNRWSNLRLLSVGENNQNRQRKSRNTSGLLGVSWMARANKWRAQICVGRKVMYLGLHETKESAYEAYLAAKRAVHPAGNL